MSLAVDISNYSGYLTSATLEAWQAAGVRKVIVGTQNRNIARQQLQACVNAQMPVDAYVFLAWQQMAGQVRRARGIVEGFPIGTLWLDCEHAVQQRSPTLIVRLILLAVAEAAKTHTIGIYTRRGWWEQATGNSNTFRRHPLWNAWYSGGERLDNFERYGGWEREAMRQYAENVQLGGVTVDMNCYDEWAA